MTSLAPAHRPCTASSPGFMVQYPSEQNGPTHGFTCLSESVRNHDFDYDFEATPGSSGKRSRMHHCRYDQGLGFRFGWGSGLGVQGLGWFSIMDETGLPLLIIFDAYNTFGFKVPQLAGEIEDM